MKNDKVWECRIGGPLDSLPPGADAPMRAAVERAYFSLTGQEPRGVFTGWGQKWTPMERRVLTPQDYSPCNTELQAKFEKHGLRFVSEVWTLDPKHPTTMFSVYGTDGSYVADAIVDGAQLRWLEKRGIWNPLSVSGEPKARASIGFATKGKPRWFGWSHRAAFGFAIGHVVKKGDVVTGDDAVSVGFVCETMDDCRRCAVAFANSVS